MGAGLPRGAHGLGPVLRHAGQRVVLRGPVVEEKAVALISLILEQYRGVFERIYIFSPSINIDDSWIPVKKHIEEDLGVNTEREQTYWDEWDEAALRRIIQQQRKITEASKKLEMKKLYQALVVIDDFADTPQLHKPHGALDTLFIRPSHADKHLGELAEAAAHQRSRAGQPAIPLLLEAAQPARAGRVVEKLSALLPKEQLYRLYEQATREPYKFLFVYYPRNEMFHKRFEDRFALEKDADGSGVLGQKLFASSTLINANVRTSPAAPLSQPSSHRPPDGRVSKKRITTIFVDSRKRVAWAATLR